jgi:hypothetical protein
MCHQSDPRPGVYFIIGNKNDLGLHRTTEHSDAERWAVSNRASYLEVSAPTGEGFGEMFATIGAGVLGVLYGKRFDENVDLGPDLVGQSVDRCALESVR